MSQETQNDAERSAERNVRPAPTSRARAKAFARRALPFAPLLLLALVWLPSSIDASLSGSERVLSGVTLGSRSLTRADRSALATMLAERVRALSLQPLGVRLGDKAFRVDPGSLGFRVDAPESVLRALAIGREGGLGTRTLGFWRRWWNPVEVPLAAALDRQKVRALLDAWEAQAIADRPREGGIEVVGTDVRAVTTRGGRRVRASEAERLLLSALLAGRGGELTLPLETVPAALAPEWAPRVASEARTVLAGPLTLRSEDPPRQLVLAPHELAPSLRAERAGATLRLAFVPERLAEALARGRRELEAPFVNAKFEVSATGEISIVPSQPGVRIAMEQLPAHLLSAARDPGRTGSLPLLREPLPELTTERATALGIRKLVSTFTTRHPCCEQRVENIHRIAALLDGTVVEPGQTVSVNALVGPRTQKNGFVPAPSIEEGEMVDSIGGGISQFATTLFNALFYGGYDIIERQPHTYWFPRYPMGHEATLSWPKPDIVFRNDTDAGLLIKTAQTNTTISVRLYGDNGGRTVRAEVSGRKNVQPAPVELLPNPAVAPDEEKVKEPGSVGWSVIVSRILTFPDGNEKEERRRVTYKPRPKRVEVHPCRIPKGDKGYTGERCPEPEDVEELVAEAEPGAGAAVEAAAQAVP